jgi:hypothetical protein
MTLSPTASGLLGLTDATSKAGPEGDWAAGWDAKPGITGKARHDNHSVHRRSQYNDHFFGAASFRSP